MENSPADFVAYFDSGAKVTLTDGRNVKFIDANGRNHNFRYDKRASLKVEQKRYLNKPTYSVITYWT